MKLIQITCMSLLLLAAAARGQVVMNTGDVFTYQFHSLDSLGLTLCTDDRGFAGFNIYLDFDTFDGSTDVLLVEMFENGTNEPPLETFIAASPVDGIIHYSTWADLQGTVRFTVLSGSVTLEHISYLAFVPQGGGLCKSYALEVFPARAATLVEQLVPCAGPRTGGQWKNHGQYVSAVNATVAQLLTEGRIAVEEAEAVLTGASRSGCGRR
jgi:hypothetical protein